MVFSNIINLVKRSIAWGKEVAQGADGTGSASRVVVLLIATVASGCLVTHVIMNHGLPSADQMYGLSAFTASGAGAYAANKIRGEGGGDTGGGTNSVNTTVITPGPVITGGTNASS